MNGWQRSPFCPLVHLYVVDENDEWFDKASGMSVAQRVERAKRIAQEQKEIQAAAHHQPAVIVRLLSVSIPFLFYVSISRIFLSHVVFLLALCLLFCVCVCHVSDSR